MSAREGGTCLSELKFVVYCDQLLNRRIETLNLFVYSVKKIEIYKKSLFISKSRNLATKNVNDVI